MSQRAEALANYTEVLLARITELQQMADDVYELAGWHADDGAYVDEKSPADMTAHVNGLIRQRIIATRGKHHVPDAIDEVPGKVEEVRE